MENDNVGKKEDEKVVDLITTNANQLAVNNSTTSSPALATDFQFIELLANQLDNLSKVAKIFIKGGLCPIKNEADFIVAVTNGMQLGLPMTTAINQIFVVNNKPAISTHLMRALLLKAGITFTKVSDYEPMYVYYEAVKGANGELEAKKIEAPNLNKPGEKILIPIERGISTVKDVDNTKYVLGRSKVDIITKYVFERMVKQPNGTYKTIKVESSFKHTDAEVAGLLEKDNYSKYPARMFDARAFAIGSREIASDILFGMYSIAELADSNGVNYTMSENFEETIDTNAEIVE